MYLNVSEAKTKFSELVDQVFTTDNEVVIGLRNVPKVKIVPIKPTKARGGKRLLGKFRGDILYMADDFNVLPEEWEGQT